MIVLCAGLYPLFIAAIGRLAPGGGKGITITAKGKVVGYENIGQNFTADTYFHGRPSAVDYNAAASGGSNKGPSNPAYLQTVQQRIDTFLAHNPTIKKEQIPADLVTASASGLDPHISPAAALVQVNRVAASRGIAADKISTLVEQHIEKTILGPQVINVLKLNVALDELK
jgi:K+-transporting ATPase ATPase C chain